MYPEGYSGEGNGLFYDYQDAVRHIRELKLLRIQNQEMIRLLKEIE